MIARFGRGLDGRPRAGLAPSSEDICSSEVLTHGPALGLSGLTKQINPSHAMSKTRTLPISAARVIVTCPGRNFVTLKIETSDGTCGLGDATLNGRELAVASYLTDHLIPSLIGRDAHAIEDRSE